MADSLTTPTLSKIHQALSRRSLMREMAGTVAIALASSTTVAASPIAFPTSASENLPTADAELIKLGKTLVEVTSRYREAGHKYDAIFDKVKNSYPALPLVLKACVSDDELGLPKPNSGKFYKPVQGGSAEQPGYYTTFNLGELEAFRPTRIVKIPIDRYVPEYSKATGNEFPALYLQSENVIVTSEEWPEARARVNELTTAIRRWEKACKRIENAFGCRAACKTVDAIAAEQNAVLDQIANTKANSADGLAVKLRAIETIFDGDEIEFGDCTADRLAADVVNDLLKTLDGDIPQRNQAIGILT
jgi:hypothetical protein